MRQNDAVALGLSAAVVAGLALWRAKALAAPSVVPGPGPVGPGPSPMPSPTPSGDANLEAARRIIAMYEEQVRNGAGPQAREGIAAELRRNADTLQAVSPAAAQELRDAAMRIAPLPGPMPAPGPAPAPTPTPRPTTPTLLERFDTLRTRAQRYLADLTGVEAVDATTLMEMERTTRELQAGGEAARATELGALTAASYAKSKLPRPQAVAI